MESHAVKQLHLARLRKVCQMCDRPTAEHLVTLSVLTGGVSRIVRRRACYVCLKFLEHIVTPPAVFDITVELVKSEPLP